MIPFWGKSTDCWLIPGSAYGCTTHRSANHSLYRIIPWFHRHGASGGKACNRQNLKQQWAPKQTVVIWGKALEQGQEVSYPVRRPMTKRQSLTPPVPCTTSTKFKRPIKNGGRWKVLTHLKLHLAFTNSHFLIGRKHRSLHSWQSKAV